MLGTLGHKKKSVRRVKEFTRATTVVTSLHKWEPMGLTYSKF
jgi:hypothetical protein